MPRALTTIVNGIAVLVIATAVFMALANLGLIARSASETFTVGREGYQRWLGRLM